MFNVDELLNLAEAYCKDNKPLTCTDTIVQAIDSLKNLQDFSSIKNILKFLDPVKFPIGTITGVLMITKTIKIELDKERILFCSKVDSFFRHTISDSRRLAIIKRLF